MSVTTSTVNDLHVTLSGDDNADLHLDSMLNDLPSHIAVDRCDGVNGEFVDRSNERVADCSRHAARGV
jgi:hypothetical protein